jgi:hypothetical protein
VTLHPNVPSWLYAATDVGVFATDDGGATWSLPHDGPANVAVFQLFWMDSMLVAVTHGRGMFTFQASTDFPAFARRPRSQGVLAGHIVTFQALAVGEQPIGYQWYRGQSGDTSLPVAGATGTSYTTPPTTATTDYWVRATNSFGSVDSPTATLTLLPWKSLLPPSTNQGSGSAGSAGSSGSTAGSSGSTADSSGSAAGLPTEARSAEVGSSAGLAVAFMAAPTGTGVAASRVPAERTPTFLGGNGGAVASVGYGAVPMSATAVASSARSEAPSTFASAVGDSAREVVLPATERRTEAATGETVPKPSTAVPTPRSRSSVASTATGAAGGEAAGRPAIDRAPGSAFGAPPPTVPHASRAGADLGATDAPSVSTPIPQTPGAADSTEPAPRSGGRQLAPLSVAILVLAAALLVWRRLRGR